MGINSPVARFEANTKGVDYVVGDIHGAFDLLMRALDAAGFNPAVDRLFCTGDLVDRGHYSAEVLNFLREPWAHAVGGNHEHMLLEMYAEGVEVPDQQALSFNVKHNGMGWWLNVTPEQRAEILDAFAQLPLVLEVDTPRGKVGLLHAEVPRGMPWAEFIQKIEAGDPLTRHSALWGRSRAKTNDTSGVSGIDRVFVGHTPHSSGVRQMGNIFVVDTGAVFAQLEASANAGRLTLANLLGKTGLITTPRPAVKLVDLRDDPTAIPFSPYAEAGAFLTVWERHESETNEDGEDYNAASREGTRAHRSLLEAQAAARQGYGFWTGSDEIWAPVACAEIEEWAAGRLMGHYLFMDQEAGPRGELGGWRWYPAHCTQA